MISSPPPVEGTCLRQCISTARLSKSPYRSPTLPTLIIEKKSCPARWRDKNCGTSLQSTACKANVSYFSTTDPKDQLLVKRAIELAERAAESWAIQYTDFLAPPLVADVKANTHKLADVGVTAWGGFQQAERCRLCIGNAELLASAETDLEENGGVAAVRVEGKFVFDAANHRDFLGACLGTGIERGKVGDILVTGETGAQIMVAPDLVEHLEASLVQVRSVPVQARAMPLSELSIPEPRVEDITTFEASLRLDSIAGAGFKVSRSKMTELVKAGDVRVNWKPAKASSTVQSGDMISCAGKGRVKVAEVNTTKKGRFAVDLVRYI